MSSIHTANNVYVRGTAINLPARFWNIDPITREPTLADPDSVVFAILSPDSVETTYTFGTDPNVTNPETGIFICALDPLLPTGIYHYNAVGTGAVQAQTPDEEFTIVDSVLDVPAPPPRPVTGPCSQWISGEDVAACAQVDPGGSITLTDGTVVTASYLFDTVAYNASLALYEISDRRFPGICERTVRPCAEGCAGPPASSGFSWFWGWGGGAGYGYGGPWGWYNDRGTKFGCGCSPLSKVRLAGYPVVEILAVTIDGEDVPEFDSDGDRNWRLDKWRHLVRMAKPGNPPQPRVWPSCQNMALDDDQPGTFAVDYRWGSDVPQIGRDAAVELANQLFLSCFGTTNLFVNTTNLPSGVITLPVGTTKIVRQGIEIDRGLLANWMDPLKGTGLVQTDLFLQAYANGSKRPGRRSAIWSPDVQPFARRVGVNQ